MNKVQMLRGKPAATVAHVYGSVAAAPEEARPQPTSQPTGGARKGRPQSKDRVFMPAPP